MCWGVSPYKRYDPREGYDAIRGRALSLKEAWEGYDSIRSRAWYEPIKGMEGVLS